MKSVIFICMVLLQGTIAQALTPKLVCFTPKEYKGRHFRVDIIYSPLRQTTSADITYISEYGTEPVTRMSLKKPGYTTTAIYFSELIYTLPPMPSEPGLPGIPGMPNIPSSHSGTIPQFPGTTPSFKMVLDKPTLAGTVEFAVWGVQNSKTIKLKVKCDSSAWSNF